VIDRKRVRELAARKSARASMIEFLSEAEGFIEELLALLRGGLPLPLGEEGRRRLKSYWGETYRKLWIHSSVLEMRLATRGRVSEEWDDLSDRLLRLKCHLDLFAGLSTMSHDGPSSISPFPGDWDRLSKKQFDRVMRDNHKQLEALVSMNNRREIRLGGHQVPTDRPVPPPPDMGSGESLSAPETPGIARCAPSSPPTLRSGSAEPPPADPSTAPPVPCSRPACSASSGSGWNPASPSDTTASTSSGTSDPGPPRPDGSDASPAPKASTGAKARSEP
jgi:hypothetical protein